MGRDREGPADWGTPVNEHVLDRAAIGSGTVCSTAGAAPDAPRAWPQIVEQAWRGSTRRKIEDVGAAKLAFMGAGPTQLAIQNSGEATLAEGVRSGPEHFTDADGRVLLPAWYRAVLAEV